MTGPLHRRAGELAKNSAAAAREVAGALPREFAGRPVLTRIIDQVETGASEIRAAIAER